MTYFNSSLDGLGGHTFLLINLLFRLFQFQFGWFGRGENDRNWNATFDISIPVWMVWEIIYLGLDPATMWHFNSSLDGLGELKK